jgi:tetratricopeptide (TPR) repeat protein
MATTASAKAEIAPIWARLPQISVYPLQSGALSMIALLSVLRLVDLIPMIGLLKLVVHFLISVQLYRYAVQALLDTAAGRLKAAEYSFEIDNSEAIDQIKLQVVLIAAIVLAFIFFGLKTGLVTLAVIAVATPAATMSLAIERSLLHALNPINWVRIAAAFGPSYLLLVAMCGFYFLAQLVAVAFLPPWLPALVSIPIIWFLSHYTTVVSFHAMGYLILQFGDEIGYRSPEPEKLPELRHLRDPDQDLLDRVDALAGRGDARTAIDELRQQIEQRGGTQKTHDRYRELLAAANDEAELARHARRYVSVLMAQDAHAKALQMLQACFASAADYCPDQIEELRPLAEIASKYGRHELAVRLLVNGIKRFAKSKENPALALFAARLLSEKLGSDAKAVQLLTAVRARYPDHPLAADIDRQLALYGAAPG